jgi:enterobactin synthetase component D / holo-[acyl-carrier protein] synthase
VIERILPPFVASAEAKREPPNAQLFLAEEAVVAGAVPERRREFTTARHLARRALAELGFPPVAILPTAQRDPQWTAGVVGSMTHCIGYRAAAVARESDAAALGIDAEPHLPLPDGLSTLIVRPEEELRLADLSTTHPGVHWDRLTFSAKESVYKVWFPLVRRWLGFEDASITFEPDQRVFTVELREPGLVVAGRPMSRLTGQWIIGDGLVITSVIIPAGDPDPWVARWPPR